MKKLIKILTVAVIVVICLTGCGQKAGTGKLEYSDIIGLWGTEEGDMTISFNDNKTGNISSVSRDAADNTEFTYVINYDENFKESSIIIMTEDDYSETYTAELDDNILTLTLHDTETGSDVVTKLIKGQNLSATELAEEYESATEATTTSVSVSAEEKAEDTTSEAYVEACHPATTAEPAETMVNTFVITKVSGTYLEMYAADDKQKYCCNLGNVDVPEGANYKVGDTITLCYDAQVAEIYPAKITVIKVM